MLSVILLNRMDKNKKASNWRLKFFHTNGNYLLWGAGTGFAVSTFLLLQQALFSVEQGVAQSFLVSATAFSLVQHLLSCLVVTSFLVSCFAGAF